MIATRLGTLLLLAMLVVAQHTPDPKSTESSIPEPKLPVIDYNACPFEGCIFREWTVTKHSTIYNTWRDNRKPVGQLTKAEKVQGLTGVYITRKPDRFLVKQPIPYFSVKAGDSILQYGEWGEGCADLWANGAWHKNFDWGQTDDGDATPTDAGFTPPLVLSEDNVSPIQHGLKEWWVQVRRANGQTGWVLAEGNFGHMDQLGDPPKSKLDRKAPPETIADIPEPKDSQRQFRELVRGLKHHFAQARLHSPNHAANGLSVST